MKVNIYMGFWTLEMKYTQYGICGEVAFKNASVMVFLEVKRDGQRFLGGSKKSRLLCGELPLTYYSSPEWLIGDRMSSSWPLCGVFS
jgi:hypothetical protein